MATLNTKTSIVDYLSSTGQKSDFATRSALAKNSGISNYTGTAAQNTQLLNTLSSSGGSKASTTPKTTPATTGKVLGASVTSDPADPFAGGASGRFLDVTDEQANEIMARDSEYMANNNVDTMAKRMAGESDKDFADRIKAQPFELIGLPDGTYKAPPTLNYNQAKGLLSELGLSDLGYNANFLVGLTADRARQVAKDKADTLGKAVSQNTSFAYNTDFTSASSSAKKLLDSYSIGLKDATLDPWKTKDDKLTASNALLENTMNGVSKLFTNASDFDNLYKSDGTFKSAIDQFAKNGGNVSELKARLPQSAPVTALPKAPVAPAYNEADSLASGNPLIDKLLAPQTAMAKQNIDYLKSVPEQYRDLYLGDAGYFTKIRQEAEDSINQLNESYKQVQKGTLADFDAQAMKNEADAKVQLAQIEENRADSKNYLNGMLAKLGALTTTGEAPAAIARMETKYNALATQTQSALASAQGAIASAKSKAIAGLEQDRLGKISAIKSDLSKSSFEIQKELMQVEQNTKKEINNQISDWQKQAASINKSFIDKAQAQKNQYEQLYFKVASGGLSAKMLADIKQNQPLTPAEASTYGVPYGTTYGQLQGKVLTNNKPLTDGQSKDALYASRIADAEKVFSDPNGGESILAKMSPVKLGFLISTQSPAGGFLGNIAQQATLSTMSPAIKSQFQAQRNLINTILRKESGAAISQGEFDNAYAQYLPQAGDTAEVLAQKKLNRQRQYQSNMAGVGATGLEKFNNVDLTGSGFDQPTTVAPQSGYNGGAVNWADL